MDKNRIYRIILVSRLMMGFNMIGIAFWPVYIVALACCCDLPLFFAVAGFAGWLAVGSVCIAAIMFLRDEVKAQKNYLRTIT